MRLQQYSIASNGTITYRVQDDMDSHNGELPVRFNWTSDTITFDRALAPPEVLV